MKKRFGKTAWFGYGILLFIVLIVVSRLYGSIVSIQEAVLPYAMSVLIGVWLASIVLKVPQLSRSRIFLLYVMLLSLVLYVALDLLQMKSSLPEISTAFLITAVTLRLTRNEVKEDVTSA